MATAPSQSRYGNPANYNTTPATRNNGDASALEVDAFGNLYIGGSVGSNTADTGGPIKVGGVYNLVQPTLTSGFRGDMQLDVNANVNVHEQYAPVAEDNTAGVYGYMFKPVNSSTYAPVTSKDAGTVTKAVVKGSPGNVYMIRITNINAAIRYIQLHNKATAPSAGETAQQYFLIPAGTSTVPAVLELNTQDFAPSEYFVTGIGWAISTTATTFTDSATASDHTVVVRYV